jgi:hypothetical protein
VYWTAAVAMSGSRELVALSRAEHSPECARRAAWTLRAIAMAGAGLRAGLAALGAIRVRCLLGGHDDAFAREPHRLYLRCRECGRSTHGWAVGGHPAPVSYRSRRWSPRSQASIAAAALGVAMTP